MLSLAASSAFPHAMSTCRLLSCVLLLLLSARVSGQKGSARCATYLPSPSEYWSDSLSQCKYGVKSTDDSPGEIRVQENVSEMMNPDTSNVHPQIRICGHYILAYPRRGTGSGWIGTLTSRCFPLERSAGAGFQDPQTLRVNFGRKP